MQKIVTFANNASFRLFYSNAVVIMVNQKNNSKNIVMGKGDKKSKRGKIILGSYGVRRRRKTNKKIIPATSAPVEEKVESKANVKTEEKVEVKAHVKTEAKAEEKADVKAEVKAEVKSEVKAEVKSEVKAEVRDEVKSEVKDEVKPGVKAEPKSAAPKSRTKTATPPEPEK
jgi:ribosomal small subunit protein bTHX